MGGLHNLISRSPVGLLRFPRGRRGEGGLAVLGSQPSGRRHSSLATDQVRIALLDSLGTTNSFLIYIRVTINHEGNHKGPAAVCTLAEIATTILTCKDPA